MQQTFWNGCERSVSTVPGCSMMTLISCRRRANSRLMHLLSWFCALLLALLAQRWFSNTKSHGAACLQTDLHSAPPADT